MNYRHRRSSLNLQNFLKDYLRLMIKCREANQVFDEYETIYCIVYELKRKMYFHDSLISTRGFINFFNKKLALEIFDSEIFLMQVLINNKIKPEYIFLSMSDRFSILTNNVKGYHGEGFICTIERDCIENRK